MTNQRSPEMLALQLDLTRRLDALETRNRRLKQLLVAVIVVVAVVATRAQVAPVAVSADRFVLVDAQNRTRATLEMSGPASLTPARYPMLTFLDGAGKPRLRVGLGARGATLETVDENGKTKDYFGPPFARPLTQ
jgi:hypothetical protein